jgi:hypothetical protein
VSREENGVSPGHTGNPGPTRGERS